MARCTVLVMCQSGYQMGMSNVSGWWMPVLQSSTCSERMHWAWRDKAAVTHQEMAATAQGPARGQYL